MNTVWRFITNFLTTFWTDYKQIYIPLFYFIIPFCLNNHNILFQYSMTLKAYFGKNGLFSEVKNFSDFKVASGMAISDFFSSTTAKVVGLTAALTAMYAAFKWADNKYNLTYGTALKNTQGHLDNIESMTGEINQLESQSQTAKDTLSSLAGKYNIEITGTETISELIDKLQGADLSLDDQIQVDNINTENDKLESQLAIKQKLLEYEQKEAAAVAFYSSTNILPFQ